MSDIKEIPLTRGQSAIVDASDYDWLNQWSWFAMWSNKSHSFYAARMEGRRVVLMHRQILGLAHGDGQVGDHKNLNTLDDRRDNLRRATYSKNNMNTRLRKDNTAGVKGVYFWPERNVWYARIHVNKKMKFLGYSPTKEGAVALRKAAVVEHYGEFARET